jgi:Xaa-Pro aminopeptidase
MYNKWGQFGKDFEEGVNFDRLRKERLERTRWAMKKHGLGAIVATRLENGRYITGFRGILIEGTIFRYVVLPVEGDPVLFEMGGDFGRAKETAPWLREKLTTSIAILGTPHTGTPAEVETRAKMAGQWAEGIKKVLKEYGVADKKVGIDFVLDVSAVKALDDSGIDYVDAQSVMMDARQIKTQDELQLLSIASQIAEAGLYTIEKTAKPGVRE